MYAILVFLARFLAYTFVFFFRVCWRIFPVFCILWCFLHISIECLWKWQEAAKFLPTFSVSFRCTLLFLFHLRWNFTIPQFFNFAIWSLIKNNNHILLLIADDYFRSAAQCLMFEWILWLLWFNALTIWELIER